MSPHVSVKGRAVGDRLRAVLFAAAAPSIGCGHLYRCLALADALRDRGVDCRFAVPEQSVEMVPALACSEHEVVCLDFTSPGLGQADLAAVVHDGPFDLAIVDSYAVAEPFERALRSVAAVTMAVDDAPTRGHDTDIVLDQTYGRSASAYRALAPRSEVVAGTDYALLRPQFAAWRDYSLNRRSASGGRIDHILVAFGGSDPDDFASPLVEQLTQDSDCAVTAILGSCHPAAARLWAMAQASCGRIRVHEHLDDVASVMADCDLAIGAAGSMSWERCTLGLPTLVAVLAPNQESVAQALIDNGAAWCLGRSRQEAGNRLARMTRELLENPERVSAASRAAAGICDGQGCARAAQALVAAMVRARGGEPGQT